MTAAERLGLAAGFCPTSNKSWPARGSTSPSTLTALRRFSFTNELCFMRLTWLAQPAARRAGSPWSRVTPTSSPPIRLGLCNVVGTLGTALGEDHLEGAASGWPTAWCWYTTPTRPGKTRLIARSSSSWEATWI